MFEAGHSIVAKGLDPVADAFAGTVYSDVYNCEQLESIEFLIYKGVGPTGTSTVTVEACDDVVPTNVSAIPFQYQAITSGDTHGALTAATTSGFVTTAGSGQLYRIYVDTDQLAKTIEYGFVRLKMVESVAGAVVGAILAIGHGARNKLVVPQTIIV